MLERDKFTVAYPLVTLYFGRIFVYHNLVIQFLSSIYPALVSTAAKASIS